MCFLSLLPICVGGQKSEALQFFESFVDSSELSMLDNGEIYFHCVPASPEIRMLLKFANRLEFDPHKKISIDNITLDHQGRMVIYTTTALDSEVFFPVSGSMLLKYFDGAWYKISICGYSLDPPLFAPNCPASISYWPIIFASDLNGFTFYSLPSGRYYLYIPAADTTESEGQITGHGAAMIEIELVNLDGETKRFTEFPTIDTYPYTVDVDAFPKYSVTVLGETLYHDPYA